MIIYKYHNSIYFREINIFLKIIMKIIIKKIYIYIFIFFFYIYIHSILII